MSAVPDREAAGSRDDDEPALVARALAGDRTALGVLVTRFAAPVRRLAYAILRDADEADDAAQDGVLQALVKLDRYDPSRPFGPWLMRIVANAAIDRRRLDARRAGTVGPPRGGWPDRRRGGQCPRDSEHDRTGGDARYRVGRRGDGQRRGCGVVHVAECPGCHRVVRIGGVQLTKGAR